MVESETRTLAVVLSSLTAVVAAIFKVGSVSSFVISIVADEFAPMSELLSLLIRAIV